MHFLKDIAVLIFFHMPPCRHILGGFFKLSLLYEGQIFMNILKHNFRKNSAGIKPRIYVRIMVEKVTIGRKKELA